MHLVSRGIVFSSEWSTSPRVLSSVCSHVNKVGFKLTFGKVVAYFNIDWGMHFFPFFYAFYYFLKSQLKVGPLALRGSEPREEQGAVWG